MERVNVESSAIAAVGYDPSCEVLEIQFHPRKDGRVQVCQYLPVSQAVYDEMMTPGGSVGRTFLQKVRANPAIECVDVTEAQAVSA